MKSGASFCTRKIRYEFYNTKYLTDIPDCCLYLYFFLFLLQIYTDFDEIRQEIENETERISGNNKVRNGWRLEGLSACFLIQAVYVCTASQLLIKHIIKRSPVYFQTAQEIVFKTKHKKSAYDTQGSCASQAAERR